MYLPLANGGDEPIGKLVELMKPVVINLTNDDMLAITAYLASLGALGFSDDEARLIALLNGSARHVRAR
jgi:cytochrome c553